MFCIVDNYDSFTFNLVHYVEKLGESVRVYRNSHDLNKIDFSKYLGIILSPGPSTPSNAGITLDVISRNPRMPILGICLGMQSIAYVLGGSIIHASRTMHGKVDIIEHTGIGLFKGIPLQFKAVRYHSLAVSEEELPPCLEIHARSSDGEIMAIAHRREYIWGLQFHPESYCTEYGITIIHNFIGGCYERQKLYSNN
jgi:anthranilate synthase/aminodeoxychorismate synthase-like glutamine amidotransferase